MGRRPSTTPTALVLALTAYLTIETAAAYSPTQNAPYTLRRHRTHHAHARDAASTRHIPPVLAKAVEVADADAAAPSSASPSIADGEWQLDFYSRPVLGADGKKLWELLVTDTRGSFFHAEAVPSNCVNSRELRQRVQRLIDEAEVKPTRIRYFRAQMKNMISIALSDLGGVRTTPSRLTYTLYDWISQRERGVYPGMAGYKPPRPEAPMPKLPVKLPDQLRGEQYAFVTLPYAEFLPGGGITAENVGFGSLCPLPPADVAPPADAMVPGIVIFSKRAAAVAAWLKGIDLAYGNAVLETRELLLEVGLDTQYLFARIRTPEQLLESQLFEEGKLKTGGLHFLSVQASAESEAPDGFWLLKDVEAMRAAAQKQAP